MAAIPQRGNSSSNSSSSTVWIVIAACCCTSAVAVVAAETWRRRRRNNNTIRNNNNKTSRPPAQQKDPNKRAQWHTQEEACFGHDTLPSILHHFEDVRLVKGSTIFQANQRRTLSYYSKARHAHLQSLVLGIPHLPTLIQKRRDELASILKYRTRGNQSHRTVIVMMDLPTQHILQEARSQILAALQASSSDDITTPGVWIPPLNLIPPSDMHVTVAIPWWWHTMLEPPSRNTELSHALLHRLKQALVLQMHFPFCLELERILLLGGKTLVALWRTVGPRTIDDGTVVVVVEDRHSSQPDPMVRLRREIVHCFTQEHPTITRPPLTYHTHKQAQQQAQQQQQQVQQQQASVQEESSTTSSPLKQNKKKYKQQKVQHFKSQSMPVLPSIPPTPSRGQAERQATIEYKTPGMGEGDGFIHTTLARLPLDCLSTHNIELAPLHRLCREATAMYAGHRMRVSRYRFLETTGAGGDSNPCVDPLVDEYLEAPTPIQRHAQTGQIIMEAATNTTDTNHHAEQQVQPARQEEGEFFFSAAAAAAIEPESYHPAATIGALPSSLSSSSRDNHNNNNNNAIPLSDLFVSNPEL